MMARIVVLTHESDRFLERRGLLRRTTSQYMFYDMMLALRHRGHAVTVQRGLSSRATGDVALLHVDATVVPQDYVDYAATFPLCLNLGATDISKGRTSGAVIGRDSDWPGPVIVKTDLNHSGFAERRHNRHALRAGRPIPFPDTPDATDYIVYDDLASLPPRVWDDPQLVVERFVPERELDGYALRFWVFCGDRGRCTRHVSPKPMVKAKDVIRRESVDVPEELQRLRERLGFDYGKFDFAVHDGRPILLDANRTPGRPPNLGRLLIDGTPPLVDGFEALIRERLQ